MESNEQLKTGLNDLFRTWLSPVLAAGGMLTICMGVHDFIVSKDTFGIFFLYRLAAAGWLFLLAFISRWVRDSFYLRLLGIGAVASTAVMIELMILRTGSVESPYVLGMVLLGVFSLCFVPAGRAFAVWAAVIILAVYAIPLLVLNPGGPSSRLAGDMIIMTAVFAVLLVFNFQAHKYVVQNLQLRLELETERKRFEEALRRMTDEVSAKTGREFFRLMVRHLADVLQVRYVIVGTMAPDGGSLRAASFFDGGTVLEEIESPLLDIPGWEVLNPKACLYPSRVRELFPEAKELAARGIESLAGVPLFDSARRPIGMLAVMDTKPMANPEFTRMLMHLFALRSAAELERLRMEDMILREKDEWETTFNTIEDAITVQDENYNITRANRAAAELLKLTDHLHPGVKCYRLFHGTDAPFEGCPGCVTFRTAAPSAVCLHEPFLGKYLDIKTFPRLDREGRVIGIVHVVMDITERKKQEEEQQTLQQRFIQAQKMESIGRLAGGVAHDFNNILSAIIGYSELVRHSLPRGGQEDERMGTVLESCQRAAALTRQLLAFSRKQMLEMRPVRLDAVLTEMAKMLGRIIGEDVRLVLNLYPGVKAVLADKNQIEQIIMNLAVNARDAMPGGGRLTVEVREVDMDEAAARFKQGMVRGRYVMVTVSDTGRGMTEEVKNQIFEPFFTTKELGKGTGLGLATVYGIVKQHGGFIYVYSEPGRGTTFRMYFPVVEAGTADTAPMAEQPPPGGKETILLVEDEETIRKLIAEILPPLGYRLISASGGREALALLKKHRKEIDMLLTDLVMPEMSGLELAEHALALRPDLKVLFMSGYTEDSDIYRKVIGKGGVLLQKPLTIKELAGKVRRVLDGAERNGGGPGRA